MTPRSQLETRIAECLTKLSDNDMQRVAEDYARIRFPDRFPRFDFRAFSKEGKSRSGWPDAWIDLGDRIDGVEASGAKAKPAVLDHLKEDLDKARRRAPRLTGFVFVSGHPEVHLTKHELRIWRRRFIDEAGIDPDRLQPVFGGGLVGELARPEFARTRIELLRLSESSTHFKLVRAGLGPDEGRLNSAFIPSAEDYAAGRVHRPQAAGQVLAHLERDGRALVRGIGASGKTVLAWLLALDAAEHRWPAYYLDLAKYADTGQNIGNALTEDLHRLGDPQVLFVLDNCHLDEPMAKELALAWEDLAPSQRPRLLLLGRELRTGRGSPIDGLLLPTLALKAQQPEVLGVYRRLAWRHADEAAPPEPRAEVLDAWVASFGGDPACPETTTDLIAFSAAVLRRMPALLKRDWTLHVSDAVDEIRTAYLDKLSEGETRNLMRLCVLAELEVPLPQQALCDLRARFEVAGKRMGLVFVETVEKWNIGFRYRLAHAALGELILQATFGAIDPVLERHAVALNHLRCGFSMSVRLARLGKTNEARSIVSDMLMTPERLLDFGSLLPVGPYLRFAREHLDVTLPHDVGDCLVDSANHPRLVECALLTPLGDLKSFLEYAAKTGELKPVFAALADDLARPENLRTLVERTLLTPLGDLKSFLEYAAKTGELKPVFAALADDLARPENLRTLVERTLLTPLNNLKSFLEYAAKTGELKPVFAALADHLARPENLGPLADRALQTPLDQLQTFLIFAADSTKLRPVLKDLIDQLSVSATRRQLARRFEDAGLDELVSVLSPEVTSKLWDSVFADVDSDSWTRSRANDSATNLNAFVTFQGIAVQKGRPELAQAPALSLVLHSTRKHWHQPVIVLRHLSHVLRCARGASASDLQRFLERVATPDWVDGLLTSAPSGGLAGSLLGLATTLEPDQRSSFLRDVLRERVASEISRRVARDAESWAKALSLLGAAAAIGIRIPRVDTDWPDTSELAGILDLRKPAPDRTTIGSLQVQLWLGLREMARLSADPVTVLPSLADPILALWQATQQGETPDTLPPHVRTLNAATIAWLEHCKAAGWRLVPPQTERAMDNPDGQT